MEISQCIHILLLMLTMEPLAAFNIRNENHNNVAVNLKTGRFDNINPAVIISSVCKAVQNCKVQNLQF